jgi:hypothetical protein
MWFALSFIYTLLQPPHLPGREPHQRRRQTSFLLTRMSKSYGYGGVARLSIDTFVIPSLYSRLHTRR